MRSIGELDALIAAALAQPVVVNDRVRGTVGKLELGLQHTGCPHGRSVRQRSPVCAASAPVPRRLRDWKRGRATLRIEIAGLRERGSASPPDPVGEFYAWATRGL